MVIMTWPIFWLEKKGLMRLVWSVFVRFLIIIVTITFCLIAIRVTFLNWMNPSTHTTYAYKRHGMLPFLFRSHRLWIKFEINLPICVPIGSNTDRAYLRQNIFSWLGMISLIVSSCFLVCERYTVRTVNEMHSMGVIAQLVLKERSISFFQTVSKRDYMLIWWKWRNTQSGHSA